MKYRVVTTMNKAGWEETGRRMAKSFQDQWTINEPLTVYAEDFEPDVEGVVKAELPGWLAEFKAHYGRIPQYAGKMPYGKYDYRFDGVKFAHKVAALTDFGEQFEEGVVIWLDADTFTHSEVNEKWLGDISLGMQYMAWLDRANSHPECGFVMFKADHPYHKKFMDAFRTAYTNGDIFKMREWHDSFVLHQLVLQKVNAGKLPFPLSLSGDRNWHHPFVNGPLGAKMDHMKGPRKAEGRSRKHDTRIPRSEAYWRR